MTPIRLKANGTCAASLEVELSDAGKRHALFDNVDGGSKGKPEFHFGNSDHVITAPLNATVLASTAAASDNSPAVAIDYGGRWFSTQFHPESAVPFWHQIVDAKLIKGNKTDYRDCSATGRQLISNFLTLAISN